MLAVPLAFALATVAQALGMPPDPTVAVIASIPDGQVIWLDFPDYLKWLGGKMPYATTARGERIKLGAPWAPGEHFAFEGPSGEGKTTHGVGVLDLRKWVIALDPKGMDGTLSSAGYTRVKSMYRPGLKYRVQHREDAEAWREIWDRVDRGLPARVVVGGPADTDNQVEQLKQLMTEACRFVQYGGGWTFYVDELEIATSIEMFNIRKYVNRMLIAARDKGTSVVSGYQAQAWVTKHAIRQARRAAMWSTGDRDMIKAVAQALGRDWHMVAEIVDQLPAFTSATIPRGKRGGPIVLTSAPKVS